MNFVYRTLITLSIVCGMTGLLLLASGCGKDKTVTRAEYVKQADAICARYNKQLTKVTAPSFTPFQAATAAPYLSKVINILTSEVSDLRGLPIPNDGGDTSKQILTKLDQHISLLKTLRNQATANTGQAIQTTLPKISASAKELKLISSRFNFKSCGANS